MRNKEIYEKAYNLLIENVNPVKVPNTAFQFGSSQISIFSKNEIMIDSSKKW